MRVEGVLDDAAEVADGEGEEGDAEAWVVEAEVGEELLVLHLLALDGFEEGGVAGVAAAGELEEV